MDSESTARLEKIRDDIDALLASPPVPISELLKRYPTAHGVYLVSDEEDRTVIYAGKSMTNREGVAGRIYDHVNVPESGNLCTRLPGGKEAVKKKLIRVVAVADKIERRDLENVLIAALHPTLNR
jgi:excinuclease UvrABC nuclease subunit